MANIDKYIDNAIQTENGYCYKDDNAFDNDFDKACYIPEAGIEALEEMQIEGEDKTDPELIEDWDIYTRNSLRRLILEYMQQYDPNYRLEDVVESELDVIVFQFCDWQCPETFLNESCIQYEYIPLDCVGEVIKNGDNVLYHDTEKDADNPDQKVVWEVLDARPEMVKITSEIGDAEVSGNLSSFMICGIGVY